MSKPYVIEETDSGEYLVLDAKHFIGIAVKNGMVIGEILPGGGDWYLKHQVGDEIREIARPYFRTVHCPESAKFFALHTYHFSKKRPYTPAPLEAYINLYEQTQPDKSSSLAQTIAKNYPDYVPLDDDEPDTLLPGLKELNERLKAKPATSAEIIPPTPKTERPKT